MLEFGHSFCLGDNDNFDSLLTQQFCCGAGVVKYIGHLLGHEEEVRHDFCH